MRSDLPRVPPGQYVTTKWPVLTDGPTPRVNLASWDLRVVGAVEAPQRLTYEEIRALPRVTQLADFHCVTTWSRLDNQWEGVASPTIAALARPTAAARFVLVQCDGGYTTNLSLEAFLADNVLFAYRHDGTDLTPEHGWPLRLVVPDLYAWKSAKWVRVLEFRSEEERGFWEQRGYHNHGDPWREQRYRSQE